MAETATPPEGLDSPPSSSTELDVAISNLDKLAKVQSQARADTLPPAVQTGESNAAALERHQQGMAQAGQDIVAAVASGDTQAADQANFSRLAAEANLNILKGQPDEPLTPRPELTQDQAQGMLEQQAATEATNATSQTPETA